MEAARIEDEVPRVDGIVPRLRKGPVVAVRAGVVEVRVVAGTDGRKENAPVRIRALACNEPSIDAIPGRPSSGAIADEG